MYILILVLGMIVLCFFTIQIVDIFLIGFLHKRTNKESVPNEFMITKSNRIDIQGEYECSAFSSAYILRHLGKEAEGFALYDKIPSKFKMSNGYVYPKGIIHCLSSNGVNVQYCKGNMNVLKSEVAKGIPVIVLIKIREDKNWLHFVPVVGYDEKYIYIAESYEPLINCDEKFYNRKVEIERFKKLWKTGDYRMPLYSNTFYRIV